MWALRKVFPPLSSIVYEEELFYYTQFPIIDFHFKTRKCLQLLARWVRKSVVPSQRLRITWRFSPNRSSFCLILLLAHLLKMQANTKCWIPVSYFSFYLGLWFLVQVQIKGYAVLSSGARVKHWQRHNRRDLCHNLRVSSPWHDLW